MTAATLTAPGAPAPGAAVLTGIILIRLSDFRGEDAHTTFDARAAELRDLAEEAGVHVPPGDAGVRIENDLTAGGRRKPASAYKTPRRVITATGLVTFRTRRPRFEGAVLDLQDPATPYNVLIAGDVTRLARNDRDGEDLIDGVRSARGYVLVPDDEGAPRWLLTAGGTPAEVAALRAAIDANRQYSEAIARNTRKGRRRWAGRSYGGGRRPFGYEPRERTAEHARVLDQVAPEAAEVLAAYASILDQGGSLKAEAERLRAGSVPTVTGVPWSAQILRDVLLKPSLAGLARRAGELVPSAAIPAPIVTRPRWQAMVDHLTDPGRKTTTGNAPRWLLSVHMTCAVCGAPTKAQGPGGGNTRHTYQCAPHGHVRRDAHRLDAYVAAAVVAAIDATDGELLAPPPAERIDTAAIAAELRRIEQAEAAIWRLVAAHPEREAAAAKQLDALAAERQAQEARRTVSDQADALPEFRPGARGGRTAAQVWEALPLARRRAVVKLVLPEITLGRLPRRGPGQAIDAGLRLVRYDGQVWEDGLPVAA
jgi:DNA invertase Pin-like site-specific DNA recombinase